MLKSQSFGWILVAIVSLLTLAVSGLQPVLAAEIDKTTIIRSLAPMRYLSEHSGQARAIDLDIEFKLGSTRLTKNAKRQLDIVIDALKDRKLSHEQFQILGHTDASGAADMNRALSQRRADAVFQYLVSKGIPKQRLQSKGLGESRLKNILSPDSGENRRVEFVLIQSDLSPSKQGETMGKEKVIKW